MPTHINISALTNGSLTLTNGIWSREILDEISYPKDGNSTCFQIEDTSYWFQHRNAVIRTLIQRYSTAETAGWFLDVGGGNGFQSKAIQELGLSTALIEPGRKGCENAIRRGVENVLNCTLADSCIPPSSIAMAGAFDVVEHIDAQEDFLAQIHKILQQEGLFFMTVPAMNWLWSFEDVHAGHFRRYSIRSATKILETTGFTIEFASYFFRPLVIPIMLLRSIPSLFRIRKTTNLRVTKKEHCLPDSLSGRLISRGLSKEREQLKEQKTIAIGSSLVVVAKKL
jgi:SAM-dependent methyltransferase